jgi:protein phosphatase
MKRKTNQDAIYLNPEKNVFIVADGMGGHNGGDIASKMAVKYVPEFLLAHYAEDPLHTLREAVLSANLQIKKRGETDPNLAGMGTTVVGFLFKGPNLYIANVGDSRAYLVHQRNLYQLTRDHSLVQEKLNLGIYDREQAADDPHKNVLVRTVGFEAEVEVDIFTYKVHRGDIFLCCSDGLHGKVSDADILHLIASQIPNPQQATQAQVDNVVQLLVAQANANGGTDNISTILVVAR